MASTPTLSWASASIGTSLLMLIGYFVSFETFCFKSCSDRSIHAHCRGFRHFPGAGDRRSSPFPVAASCSFPIVASKHGSLWCFPDLCPQFTGAYRQRKDLASSWLTWTSSFTFSSHPLLPLGRAVTMEAGNKGIKSLAFIVPKSLRGNQKM